MSDAASKYVPVLIEDSAEHNPGWYAMITISRGVFRNGGSFGGYRIREECAEVCDRLNAKENPDKKLVEEKP